MILFLSTAYSKSSNLFLKQQNSWRFWKNIAFVVICIVRHYSIFRQIFNSKREEINFTLTSQLFLNNPWEIIIRQKKGGWAHSILKCIKNFKVPQNFFFIFFISSISNIFYLVITFYLYKPVDWKGVLTVEFFFISFNFTLFILQFVEKLYKFRQQIFKKTVSHKVLGGLT